MHDIPVPITAVILHFNSCEIILQSCFKYKPALKTGVLRNFPRILIMLPLDFLYKVFLIIPSQALLGNARGRIPTHWYTSPELQGGIF